MPQNVCNIVSALRMMDPQNVVQVGHPLFPRLLTAGVPMADVLMTDVLMAYRERRTLTTGTRVNKSLDLQNG
jgi:hypothetical protein